MASTSKVVVVDDRQIPIVIEPATQGDPLFCDETLAALVSERLPRTGAMLFRNFRVGGVEPFEAFARAFGDDLLTYDYRSTPRSNISGKIYTSTEYPASQAIPLHNEMAYTRDWPMRIWFYSIAVAPKGGETPIADSREIFRRIPPAIRDRFVARGVMYVRNYRVGLDLPWQQVFNTDDRSEVEAFCQRSGIEYQWKRGDELSTRQCCQGVATHPSTGELVWFNQAHLFHISSLEPRFRHALESIYKQEDLPRNALYGDGTPIPDDDLNEIRRVIDEVTVVFRWQPEDVLMLDNMLVAHGRTPFEGTRKVAVAMAAPVGRASLSTRGSVGATIQV